MTFNHQFVTPPRMKKVEVEGIRCYETVDGAIRYESVTTYIGRLLPKPELHKWRKRVGEKKATEVSAAAAKRGTSLHSAVENYLRNEPLNLTEEPNTNSLFQKVRPIVDRIDNIRLIETPLYSNELKLAGTPDLIAEYSGTLAVCDIKSSTRMKRKIDAMGYWLQTACYGIMFNELYGTMPEKSVLIYGIPDLSYGVCHIVPMEDCIKWFHEFRADPVGFHARLEKYKNVA